VWLQFSYVTDDAILHEGIVIDDIRVAALGFVDGAEAPTTEWDLQGWVRAGAAIPQTWSLQVVEWSQGVAEARKLPVDASGRAAWTPTGTLERAVLVVAGTAPVTLQRAQYNLSITP
jgi:hypothetical protein